MQNYNLERTRAPRKPIPWWVYVGSVLLVTLVVWGIIRIIPGKEQAEAVTALPSPVESVEAAVPPAPPSRATSATPPPAAPIVTPAPAAATPVNPPPPPPNPVTAPATRPATAPAATLAPMSGDLAAARAAQQADQLEKARELGLAALKAASTPEAQQAAEALLNEVGMTLLLTPRAMKEKTDYVVAPGDSLEKIAKKFGTTVEMIRISNNIRGSLIRAGDRLRVFTGKFSIEVSKSANDLVLRMNGEFFKRYRVGTGEFNKTPVGDFIINDRIAQPTWWRPDGKAIPFGDKENLLGTHWLSINVKGYGLHGTWEPETIGKQASAGCVRMLNEDIEELFNIVTLGTPVSIRD